MQGEKKDLKQKIKGSYNAKLLEVQGATEEHIIKQEALNLAMEKQLATVDSKFNKSIQCLVQSYDEHMKKNMAKPEFLPIRVNVIFQWKVDKNLDNILINPFDNVEVLINKMTSLFEQRGDPVVDWKADQLKFKIIGPLAGHAGDEEMKGDQNVGMSQERLIDDKNAPF